MRDKSEGGVRSEAFTVAGWKRGAPVPRRSAPRGLRAAWDVTLFTVDGARGIVAEGSQRVGADQASVLRVFLRSTGHS